MKAMQTTARLVNRTIITRKQQNKSATCVVVKIMIEKKTCMYLMSFAYYQIKCMLTYKENKDPLYMRPVLQLS